MVDLNMINDKQKRVMAKTLLDLNVSATKVSDALGISRASTYRYAQKPTPDELRHFETEMRMMVFVKQTEILANILKSIGDGLCSSSMKDLVAAYAAIAKGTFTQINDIPGLPSDPLGRVFL
jgi:hypothetical protein